MQDWFAFLGNGSSFNFTKTGEVTLPNIGKPIAYDNYGFCQVSYSFKNVIVFVHALRACLSLGIIGLETHVLRGQKFSLFVFVDFVSVSSNSSLRLSNGDVKAFYPFLYNLTCGTWLPSYLEQILLRFEQCLIEIPWKVTALFSH